MQREERTMEQRVMLISGGARGIGRAIAEHFTAQGWAVAVCYRRSEADAADLVARLTANGGSALAVRADVSDPVRAQALVEKVEADLGRVDALINCAGPYRRVNILEETIEGWHEMFNNNLHPVFYLSRAVAPGMRARKWGRIISFAMANADQHVGQPGITAHYIAKAGVLTLTRTLARALAPHGITVNTVSPGFIESGSAPAEELAKMVKNIPAGYIGATSDAVSAVSYLLSDEARYVNGTNLHLSGAWGV
jgi:3-oxoacyl-[acyl-carrier protein] reductase